MKEFSILKFLDKFEGIFERFGIDYPIMRRILQVKLTLDGRRTPTAMINSSKKKKRKRIVFSNPYGFIYYWESYLFP